MGAFWGYGFLCELFIGTKRREAKPRDLLTGLLVWRMLEWVSESSLPETWMCKPCDFCSRRKNKTDKLALLRSEITECINFPL